MSYITLNKNGTNKYGNFTEKELFSKSIDAGKEHELNKAVIDGFNLIRAYYGVPMFVHSTYRTRAHELVVLGKTSLGQHYYKNAGDIGFSPTLDSDSDKIKDLIEYQPDLVKQFREKGELYYQLRNIGITGFGVYDFFVHIDARPEGSVFTGNDSLGKYSFWDETNKLRDTPQSFIKGLTSGYSSEDGTLGMDEKKNS